MVSSSLRGCNENAIADLVTIMSGRETGRWLVEIRYAVAMFPRLAERDADCLFEDSSIS